MSRRPQDTVHVDVVETERRSAKSSRCVGATTESGSRPDVLSPAHGGACDVVDDGLPPTPMNEKKEKRRGIQAAGGSSSSSTMTRTNRKCSRRRRRCSSLGHHVEDVTFGADSRHYDANLASRVNRGLDSGLESDHDHDHGSPSFGSVVHHPFGLPLAWFLNKDLRASGNDDEDGDDDDDTGDRKPAVAQGGGGEGTANQDWATGGGAGAAAAEEDTTTSEATSKVVLNRKVEAMDLPCLLTASTSSTSDSDIVLLRGIESSSSDDENASATGDVAGTLTEVSSRTDFEPVTRGGDDQVEICRRRDKTNGSTAVSPPLSPSVFASATACGGAEEVGGIPPAGDEEAKAISKASPTIKTMFPSIVAKLEELAAGMPPSSVVDAVLQESYDAWLALGLKWTDHRKDENNRQPKPGEPRLTKLLCDGMKECMSRPDLEVIHQEGLKPEDGAVVSTGHPDVLVCAKSRYDSAAHACLMVEVGFGDTHHARWKKVHQLRQYEHMLRCGTNRVRLTSKPMLLSTLTIKRVGDDSFEFESGSLAVFLVTPKNEDGRHGSRVCLLTRTTTESLQVLSAALGQVLRAALALPLLDDDLVDFEYLGPNACRIGDKVCWNYRNVFHSLLNRVTNSSR